MNSIELKLVQTRKKCYSLDDSSGVKDIQHPAGTEEVVDSQETWLKCRYIVAFVAFVCYFFLNAYRINVSVGIVAMVNNSALSEQTETESDSCPELLLNLTYEKKSYETQDSGEFHWSPEIQGYMLGSYFMSFMIIQIPVGKLAERYGFKWILFSGTVTAAVATLAIPLASSLHAYAFIAMQLLRGIGQGFYLPTVAILVVNWFPKTERGYFYTFIVSGCEFGGFLGSVFSGILCKATDLGGWRLSYYTFGVAGIILSIVIAYFVYEGPNDHPRISKAELQYILKEQEGGLSRRRPNPPWGKILKSVPVHALILAYFGNFWALSQFLIVHSTFLGTILHYPIKQNGVFSAVPFLLMFLCAQVSNWLSSVTMRRKCASVNTVRKTFNFLSCFGFSACMLGIYSVGCNKYWSITFSILSMGFLGLGRCGSWILPPEMSPTFAASLNSICCTIGCLPTFILPIIVGYLTNEMQTIEQWNKVFFITIGVVMTSGIVFSVFGSAEVQPWNYVEDAPKDEKAYQVTKNTK